MPKKKSKNKNYERLDYVSLYKLQEDFNVSNLTCGFMREFYYNEKTNKMKGFCYYRQDLGLNPICTNTVPFRHDNCKVYKEFYDRKKK